MGKRLIIETVTWALKPTIERVIIVSPTAPVDPCSQLVGEFQLAGCTAYVPTSDDRADLLGDYIPGGPTE